MLLCNFKSLEDQFNFGRYDGLSLADVLDINPSYLSWCVKHCTGVIFQVEDQVIEDIRIAYPKFIMDALFESKRIWNFVRDVYRDNDCEDYFNDEDDEDDDMNYYNDMNYYESPTYDRYSGSWVQDVEGYSDDDIDTIFDGDPSAYWNID